MNSKRISAVIVNRLRYAIAARLEHVMCLSLGSGMLEPDWHPNWHRDLINLHQSVEIYRESI